MEDKVKEYLLDNIDILKQVVQDLNSWNGCLNYLSYDYNDEEFFNNYFYNKPYDAVQSVFYGEYNFNDEYVRFDGYNNLKSFSEYEYEEELKSYIDEIVDNLIECKDEITIYDYELKELLEGE